MSIDEIRNEKIKKRDALTALGIQTYPADTHSTHTIGEVLAQFTAFARTETSMGKEVTIAGRIMSKRGQGGTVFCHIYDGTGKMQVYVKLGDDGLAEDVFSLFDKADPSDFIEVTGECMHTKRGEPSVFVRRWRMLTKALQPVPTEHFGIEDEEDRLRKRYLDILLNPEVKKRIEMRSRFWNVCRSFLLERSFVEVETPVLEVTTGGADARPFTAHHNALDMPVHLRISAGELWQKRLMVAGMPRVFEIGRIFRNEGMSFEHAQDYTQLEYYMAYADYRTGMQMTKDLYRRIADEVFGQREFVIKGMVVNLDHEWEMLDFSTLLLREYNIDPRTYCDITPGSEAEKKAFKEIQDALEAKQIPYEREGFNIARGVDLLWKTLRKHVAGPAFLVGVPVYLEPLAKRSSEDSRVVERFQVILAGSEMGKGFTELNDPADQRARFEEQQRMRDAGDEEAQMADWSYVEALEYGMPPTFGFGVSERLFSFLLDIPIREAQIFPLLKPKTTL